MGTTRNGKSLSLKELPSPQREGGEAGKRHEVHFAAGVGFYNPIIILPPVSLYKTPACVLQKLVRCTRICKHIAPPEGEKGKKENANFKGFYIGNPAEMADPTYRLWYSKEPRSPFSAARSALPFTLYPFQYLIQN